MHISSAFIGQVTSGGATYFACALRTNRLLKPCSTVVCICVPFLRLFSWSVMTKCFRFIYDPKDSRMKLAHASRRVAPYQCLVMLGFICPADAKPPSSSNFHVVCSCMSLCIYICIVPCYPSSLFHSSYYCWNFFSCSCFV